MRKQRGKDDLSNWNKADATKYDVAKHGPDGANFLDPHLYQWMSKGNLAGRRFLDIGGGTGPWTEFALRQGVEKADLLDLNPAMVAQARTRMAVDDVLPENLQLVVADAKALPYPDESFDRLISINLGCNLPPEVFQAHFKEAYRVAVIGAKFMVAAPDSLLVNFTNGISAVDVQDTTDALWADLANDRVPKLIIDQLRHLLRATFVLDKDGKPVVVTNDNRELIAPGSPILRRIPGLVVDNNFHFVSNYLLDAIHAGWKVVDLHRDKFGDENERDAHNEGKEPKDQLGPEYVKHPSFMVMELEKAA